MLHTKYWTTPSQIYLHGYVLKPNIQKAFYWKSISVKTVVVPCVMVNNEAYYANFLFTVVFISAGKTDKIPDKNVLERYSLKFGM
jgi:hypothetical protein